MTNWSSTENFSVAASRAQTLLASIPSSRLRLAAFLLIAIWFLLILSGIFWSLVPVPKINASLQSPSTSAMKGKDKNQSESAVEVKAMQQWHLFGEAEQQAIETDSAAVEIAEGVADDAKETRLRLTLLGLIKFSEPGQGWAVISHNSKSELYSVGDNIPGGRDVRLAKVLIDRVIIDNRGSYESLLLWDVKKLQAEQAALVNKAPAASSKKVVDNRSNSRLSGMAGDYRKQLLSDPMSLADVIKVSVAKDADGNIMGYRVRPGRHRRQFAEFGLKSGDIVTAVNGTSLDDPSQAMQLYGQLREATEASFEVKRGDEELTLIISLGN